MPSPMHGNNGYSQRGEREGLPRDTGNHHHDFRNELNRDRGGISRGPPPPPPPPPPSSRYPPRR